MKLYGIATRGPFLVLTFLAVSNVLFVIVSAIHHRDPWDRLPLFTILLAVIIIWAASARLQTGLSKVCSQVDDETGVRLQNSAHLMALMANIALTSALQVLH
jgi:hypothetical protein